jgi:hypothetical protein
MTTDEWDTWMDSFADSMDKDPSFVGVSKMIQELKQEIMNSDAYRKLKVADAMLSLRMLGKSMKDDYLLLRLIINDVP